MWVFIEAAEPHKTPLTGAVDDLSERMLGGGMVEEWVPVSRCLHTSRYDRSLPKPESRLGLAETGSVARIWSGRTGACIHPLP